MPDLRVTSALAAALFAFAGDVAGAPASGAAPGSSAEAPVPALDPARAFLSAERSTLWNPGMMGAGGIPARSTVCSTLTPSGGTQDDTKRIQAAINACPTGQVVRLSAGTFFVNGGNYILLNKGITLRGARPGLTTLAKTDGAKPFQSEPGPHPSPIIVVGTSLFSTTGDSIDVVGSTNLTSDAAKGNYTVTVANPAGFTPGQVV